MYHKMKEEFINIYLNLPYLIHWHVQEGQPGALTSLTSHTASTRSTRSASSTRAWASPSLAVTPASVSSGTRVTPGSAPPSSTDQLVRLVGDRLLVSLIVYSSLILSEKKHVKKYI